MLRPCFPVLLSLLFQSCCSPDTFNLIDVAKHSDLSNESTIGKSIHSWKSLTENLRASCTGQADINKRESLCFIGLLKQYGISVKKDEKLSSDNFYKAVLCYVMLCY